MTTTKTRKITHIPDALRSVTILEAVKDFHALDDQFGLIPSSRRAEIIHRLERIPAAAASLHLTGASDLVTGQRSLLTALTNIAEPTRFHNDADLDQLHTCRNLLMALAIAAAHVHDWDIDGLLARAVSLAPRTHRRRRPFADDEILLMRLVAVIIRRTDPKSPLPAMYALVETGMVPGETSNFRSNDLDDPNNPTQVLAAGNRAQNARFLPLDRFAARILVSAVAQANQRGLEPHETVIYRGTKNAPGSPAATASVQGVLNRFLKQLGLHQADVSASSIRKWRLEQVYIAQGVQAALAHAGYGSATEDQDRLWLHLDLLAPLTTSTTEPDDDEDFLN